MLPVIPETSIDPGPLDRPGRLLGDAAGRQAVAEESEAAAVAADGALIDSSTGAALRFLAAVLRAKAVVEVGTGTGDSARWLLAGMAPSGLLTSIDLDPTAQRIAREALAADGVPRSRTRFITGLADQVLPRLAEGAYDLMFVDAAPSGYPMYLEVGSRLLRPGGAIVFAGTNPPETADRHDSRAAALRELTQAIRADEGLVPVALPVGDGLLAVARST